AILPLLLAGCTQPQLTAPTKTIGMPIPAAVYCQQSGGTRVPMQTPQGVSTQCKLPSGETFDEWALRRRDGQRAAPAGIDFGITVQRL
ncbi:putative hemolysin, partial [Klebsiella pneumoniae]|uniref:putative hemolysin n=1 Tax=Klebsiella pneumoniae TaxID=573 RepID=UPI00351DFED4